MIFIEYIIYPVSLLAIFAVIFTLLSVICFITDSGIGDMFGCICAPIAIILAVFAISWKIENNHQVKGKIKIDDSVTVQELTDTFIIENYDIENDIWEVKEKEGGIKLSDLSKGE